MLFMMPFLASARLLPKEDGKLHYRIIGFYIDSIPSAKKYTLDIALGNFNAEDSFKKNIILSRTSGNNNFIAEVPYFGRQYTWRITSAGAHSSKSKTRLYHFSTTAIPDLDSNNTRLRVTKNTGRYKDALFFLDGNRAIYDAYGQPVWYLPAIDGLNNETLRDVRDMKLSPQGTITFLLNNVPYEINYDGDILWKAPNNGRVSGDSIEHYHHEFTRLSNGHYMALGSEYALWKLPQSVKSDVLLNPKTIHDSINNIYYQKVEFGTIIEYDEKGDVVWSWRSSGYFRNSDLRDNINALNKFKDVHENSFFFDEKNQNIIISFRNISRILKIHYPDGGVINTYGNIYEHGANESGNDLFCNQHSCKISTSGNLYMFNNNCCHKGASPQIVVMNELNSGENNLKIIWEYSCLTEDAGLKAAAQFTSGGNVVELPDHAMFVSFANDLSSNILIVNSDKKILWSAIPEKWNLIENKWEPVYQYRASIATTQKEIGSLIWNGAKK